METNCNKQLDNLKDHKLDISQKEPEFQILKEKVEERRDLTQCENMIKELREFLERKNKHLNEIEVDYKQMK